MASARIAPYVAAHATPKGPGDARPTALKVLEDQGLLAGGGSSMQGKVFLVTGCTSGIGVETARALHGTGADVFITGRDMAKAGQVVSDIQSSGGRGRVEAIDMDLSSLDSVRTGAKDFLSRSKNTLNVLINNAEDLRRVLIGGVGVMACPEGKTKDGNEMQFGVNHLAHFLLFQLLKPTLLACSTPAFQSRVVSVSSTGHRMGKIHPDPNNMEGGYSPWGAYGQAKLANVYLANEIERRYGARGLHAWSLMPGGIATPLQKHLDPSFMENALKEPTVANYMKSTEQGAATSVWAAAAKELEGMGGKYLEDCAECEPEDPVRAEKGDQIRPGYAPQAYDPEAERKLWELSCRMVGVQDD